MKLNLRTKVQQNKEILASDLDGEKVMMSIKKGEYYGLGNTGTFIWNNMGEQIEIKELIKRIVEVYDINEEQCMKDILPFLHDLLEKELIIATYIK